MVTEIFVENNRIDISADISALLTFALDDVKDFSSRQTTFSKTIVLPGTANNNRLFGHIFQFGSNNDYDAAQTNIGYNFNAAKSAACIIFQNNLQTFQGSLRMLTITVDGGKIEYEVAMFGNLSQLNVALSPNSINNADGTTTNKSGYLENLDFSSHDHALTTANIIASWSATPGAGYYYPLIDYGNYSTAAIQAAHSSAGFKQKRDWCIGTFRPALYVKEYLDKMFAAAGFTYQCDLFNSTRFKKLIIPHNQKTLQKVSNTVTHAEVTTPYSVIGSGVGKYSSKVTFDSFSGTDFTIDAFNQIVTYTGTSAATLNIQFDVHSGSHYSQGSIAVRLYKNSTAILLPSASASIPPSASPTALYVSVGVTNYTVNTGDAFYVSFDRGIPNSGETFDVTISSASFSFISNKKQQVNVNYGDTVAVNDAIPKNIKQIDFLVSIVKLFNLYVYEDKFNPRLIHIKPFADNTDGAEYIPGFYLPDSSNTLDWTYKLNHNKPVTIKPMSELTANVYNFKMADDSDYYNDLYKKRYNQNYGDYIFNSQFEFSTDSQECQVIFAGTPLVGYQDEAKVYSTIFKRTGDNDSPVEEQTDSVIRILQTSLVSVAGSPWSIFNTDGSVKLAGGANITTYGYAGHINSPDVPASDLNFGALNELFFALATGALNNTQFNIYWSGYMAEITDKNSKLVTASFCLTPADIYNLDFSKYIQLNGALFRLNKITDYNASTPGDCQVELIRVLNTTY